VIELLVFSSILGFGASVVSAVWWGPKAYGLVSGIWQHRSENAPLFRIILGLLDQDGWSLSAYDASHPSGVRLSGGMYLHVYLSSREVQMPMHWKQRIARALARKRAELQAADLEARSTEFASNVIAFAKARAR
jgi:hypothetical protein